ncbi:MAG: hypothetical protein OIF57_16470 [Marinobacterium sp.]|nr:hypothetical protein [Marinobacterium sp.]
MNEHAQVPENMRLSVIARIEAGCLGPEGDSHIEPFCRYANKAFFGVNKNVVDWFIIPRTESKAPEFEYQIQKRRLSDEKTDKYLEMLGTSLADFEQDLNNRICDVIEQYMERYS